ncbi:MAG: hypothetical protein ABDH66_06730 [Bacteroidia bacterium]
MISLRIPKEGLQGLVHLPLSKSLSNRQLIVGAHTGHPFTIQGLSEAEDTQQLLRLLREVGYEVQRHADTWKIIPPATFRSPVHLYAGEGGTTLRFLLPLLAHLPVTSWVDAAPSLRRRPIEPLLRSLVSSGAKIEYHTAIYPLKVVGNPLWRPTQLSVDTTLSSQFLSALLLLAPYLTEGSTITELAPHPATPAYRNMTRQLLQEVGYDWQLVEKTWILRHTPSLTSNLHFAGEADWSAAGYFFGWAALGAFTGSLPLSLHSIQPERELFTRLSIGYEISPHFQGITVTPARERLMGILCDVEDYPDAVLALAVVAAFAESPSRLRGIQTLPYKESNRLHALATELRKIGATIHIEGSDLIIEPVRNLPAELPVFESHGDHRMAMALSLIAARSKGPIYIEGAECVRKSFPHYWEVLQRLGAEVRQFT